MRTICTRNILVRIIRSLIVNRLVVAVAQIASAIA